MSDQSQAPATKEDIAMIMDTIGRFYDDILDKMDTWKQEIIHEFKVTAEDIRHDALGQKDRIENHEDRIRRLEKHVRFSRP